MGASTSRKKQGLDTDKPYKNTKCKDSPTDAASNTSTEPFDSLEKELRQILKDVQDRKSGGTFDGQSNKDIRSLLADIEKRLKDFNEQTGYLSEEKQKIKQLQDSLDTERTQTHKLQQKIKRLEISLDSRDNDVKRLGERNVKLEQKNEELLKQIDNSKASSNSFTSINATSSTSSMKRRSISTKDAPATFVISDYTLNPSTETFTSISSMKSSLVSTDDTCTSDQKSASSTQPFKFTREAAAESKRMTSLTSACDNPNLSTETETRSHSKQAADDFSGSTEKEVNQDLQCDMGSGGTAVEELNEMIRILESTVKELSERLAETQSKNLTLSENNAELLNRLSKMAGEKLTENNPAITDLSDPHRPNKLGEVYSEIYDNEWTDAFEELHDAGYNEEESIETLRLTLLNTLEFCQLKSESLMTKTKEAVDILFEEYKQTSLLYMLDDCPKHLTIPGKRARDLGMIFRRAMSTDKSVDESKDIALQRRWKPKQCETLHRSTACSMIVKTPDIVTKQLKLFRKEVAESMVPLVQRAYLSASWNATDCVSAVKPYIKKCLFLSWMMVVQSPPLVFATCPREDSFNSDLYRRYTKSGALVEYVVWPALLLHEGGPVVGKGVAQGMKT